MKSESEVDFKLRAVREQRATDGVRKFLCELQDESRVETVLIPGPRRTTLCVSSQVGCAVGCTFCATAGMGGGRNLSAEEIVGQYLLGRQRLQDDPDGIPHPIENIVFMGMGEPFLNFENVTEALRILIADHGFHSRIITVSTIGIPRYFVPFGREFPHVRLALSLHSPHDESRSQLVPINRRHPLPELMEACRAYNRETGRTIFIEYVLIAGVNDRAEDAEALAGLLEGIDAKVNMIPLNPGEDVQGNRPDREACDLFRSRLKAGFSGHVTIRRSRGTDIDAACGQLAAREA